MKKCVSIPAWYDWKISPSADGSRFRSVSIPAWYDWKSCETPKSVIFSSFNSSMVRLEVLRNSQISNFFKFQFQHGTIGSSCETPKSVIFSSFNSSMVRLEVVVFFKIPRPEACFNSSMVRLEVSRKKHNHPPSDVSIPAWYDWKKLSHIGCECLPKFQFQHGTIGSPIRSPMVAPSHSFQFQHGTIGSSGSLN